MDNKTIDINVDLGEGIGNEAQILPFISSCNIACGGHAGNIDTMLYVVKLAKKYGVKIGAHPSFPDKENFGRVAMNMSYTALYTSIKQQIQSLQDVLFNEHAVLHHIKPHGALYNLAAANLEFAQVIIDVMKSLVLPVKLYVPYQSIIANLAIKNNIAITYEAFADRNYNTDLSLVSRQQNNALITNANAMFNHVYYMILKQKVKTIAGLEVDILANTFCIHGDHTEAVVLIKRLTEKLKLKGIKIK